MAQGGPADGAVVDRAEELAAVADDHAETGAVGAQALEGLADGLVRFQDVGPEVDGFTSR
jgi:hypothetical protein